MQLWERGLKLVMATITSLVLSKAKVIVIDHALIA
jgi:hypothetical protein